MDRYRWANGTEVFEAVEFQVRTSGGDEVGEGAVAREILRLAQREFDLLATVRTLGERDVQHLARIAALEANRVDGSLLQKLTADNQALEKERDGLALRVGNQERRIADLEAVIRERGQGTPAPEEIDRDAFEALDPVDRFLAYREAAGWALVARDQERLRVEKEHQLALAKAAALDLGAAREGWRELDLQRRRNINRLSEQLAASESRGRQYCAELAENAERIRELEGQLSVAEELAADRLAYIADFEPQAIATGQENERLRAELELFKVGAREQFGAADRRIKHLAAAIDGLAHVERARQHFLVLRQNVMVPGGSLDRDLTGAIDPLDLAYEVLSRAGGANGTAPVYAPEAPFGGCVPGTLAHAQFQLRCLAGEVRAAEDRIARLDESRGHHVVMLTDHADRLKAAEHFQAQQHERMVGIEQIGGKLAAMDEGLRRLDMIEEELRRHDRLRLELEARLADANRFNRDGKE